MNKDTKISAISFAVSMVLLVGGIGIFFLIKERLGLKSIFDKPAIIRLEENYFIAEVAGEKVEIGVQKTLTPVPDKERVGDQNASIPYAKLSRFNGEVSMHVSYFDEGENYEILPSEDKVVWKGDSHEVHFYPIKPEKKTSFLNFFQVQAARQNKSVEKFEVELILNEKPDTNIFEFDISTEGLNFYYQPELTEKEKGKGAFRPEEIIGSYAVYYKEQEGVIKNAKDAGKYKAGKAFHIYRPLIKDASGKEIWGELNVNTDTSILSVTVSQEFLENASYPVSVDPTFGYDDAGASSWSEDVDAIVGSVFATHSEGAEGVSISAYMSAPSTGETVKMAAYNFSDGTIVPDSETGGFTVTTEQWYTQNFSSPPQFDKFSQYALVTWSGNSPGLDANLYYDSVSLNQSVTAEASFTGLGGVFPSSVSFIQNLLQKFSIYVTYSSVEETSEWELNEETCNELDGWAWYVTNGRGACWSKTLIDYVSWNKGVGNDSDNPGTYTCATDITSLKDRMIAATNKEWYKIVSDINGVTITSADNGQPGSVNNLSAAAITDCVDGTRDLCTGDGCLGADLTAVNTSLATWAITPGKSALPYCVNGDCNISTNNDFMSACEQNLGYDLPLNCSTADIFYKNQKVCNDGDANYTWAAAAGDATRIVKLGDSICSNVVGSYPSSTSSINGFRVVVRPGESSPEPPSAGATHIGGVNMQGICVGDEVCPLPLPWKLNESTCNELDGWAWYVTNGREACWSKTLADGVPWNKGVGDDTDNPGIYTCATDVTLLKDRMIAASSGEWYKIVSNVNGVTIDSSKNGSAGYSSISALAVSDCIDGTRDLCTGDGCLGADVAAIDTSLASWAIASGKSALPYCVGGDCSTSANNDFWNACEQNSGYDLPLNCSISEIFYENQKVCNDGDPNVTWAAAAGSTTFARLLGGSSCSDVSNYNTSGTYSIFGFRAVVRP